MSWFYRYRIALLSAACLFFGVWLLAGSLTTAPVEAILSRRLGMPVRIGLVGWGWNDIALLRVRIGDAGAPVSARISKLKVGGAWSYLFRGRRSLMQIEVVDGEIELQIDNARAEQTLSDWITRARGGEPDVESDRASSERTSTKKIDVRDLGIRFLTKEGELLQIQELDATYAAGELSAEIERVRFGIQDRDHITLKDVTFELVRQLGGGIAISSVHVEQAVLSQQAVETPAPNVSPLLEQARQLVKLAKHVTRDSSRNAAPREHELHNFFERVQAHMKTNSKIQIDTFQFASAAHAPHSAAYEIHDLSLRRKLDDHLELIGKGETSTQGSLQWHFDIDPQSFQIQGNLDVQKLSAALLVPFLREIPWHEPEKTYFSASLVLETQPSLDIAYRGGLTLENVSLFSEKLAPQPISGLALDIKGNGLWHPALRSLELSESTITMGKVRALLQGNIARNNGSLAFDLTLSVPRTDCQNLIEVIPADVLGDYRDFFLIGEWSGNAKLKLDTAAPRAAELTAGAADDCDFARTPAGVDADRFATGFTTTIQEGEDKPFEVTTGPGTSDWTPHAQISPYLVQAVLAHEDSAFYRHHGFAPWAIRDALARDIEAGHFVGGASTISMQLAKNLFLSREKTLSRKVKEVLLTWWLERTFTKDQILELYLNVIEYGPKIYGIKRAAAHYFGRAASDLSPAESAFLATILPSPKTYAGMYARNKVSTSTLGRMRALLEHMQSKGRISEEALAFALDELTTFGFWKDAGATPELRTLPAITTEPSIKTSGDEEAPPFDPWESAPETPEN